MERSTSPRNNTAQKCRGLLIQLLNNPSEEVMKRLAAADALGTIGTPEAKAVRLLVGLFASNRMQPGEP